ncbi:MAG TPA: hypothetical protein VKA48_04670, partial [Gammaproteobacteria bacterium]|nr:hypothetical protein [Gammaproteobacteria bacterium]
QQQETPDFHGGPSQQEVESQVGTIKNQADQRRAELDALSDEDLSSHAKSLGVKPGKKNRDQIINNVLLKERGAPGKPEQEEAAQTDLSPDNPFREFVQADTGINPLGGGISPEGGTIQPEGPQLPEGFGTSPATPNQDLAGSNPEEVAKANALKQAQQEKDQERQGTEGQVEIDQGEGGPDLFNPDTQQELPDTDITVQPEGQEKAPANKPKKQGAGNQPNTRKDSVLTAVRKLGGIQREDLGGEIDPESFKRDTRAFRKNGGDSLDGMAQRLREVGYPVEGPDQLVQLIDQEQKGQATYAPEAYEDQQAQPESDIDEDAYEAQYGGLLDTEADSTIDSEGDIPFERRGRYTPNITEARQQVDTQPSEGQKAAGNYRKGHFKPIPGLEIGIENPRGSTRSGRDQNGRDWSVKLQDDYGYVKRTEGADGDQLDVFIGQRAKKPDSPVFVVDQQNPQTGEFDEHKVMLGYRNRDEARKAYKRNFERGWRGLGSMRDFRNVGEFRDWLANADLSNPASSAFGSRGPRQEAVEAPSPDSGGPSYTVSQGGQQY